MEVDRGIQHERDVNFDFHTGYGERLVWDGEDASRALLRVAACAESFRASQAIDAMSTRG